MEWSPEDEGIEINEEGLPFCCTATVLGEASPGEAMEAFDKCIEQAVKGEGLESEKAGLLLYTLDDANQKPKHAILLKHGFKALETFESPQSGNNITLFGFVLSKPSTPRATRTRPESPRPGRRPRRT